LAVISTIGNEAEGLAAGRRLVPPTTLPSAIAGHGQRSMAVEAADPLEVNAVLFVTGSRRSLLVTFDLLYISGTLRGELLAVLARRWGFADADVFLFASHTHFAPPTDSTLPALGPFDEAYALRVREAVLDLVEELTRKAPLRFRLETRRGCLAHSVNRRRPRLAPTFTRTSGLSFARVSFAPYLPGQRDDTATLITLTGLPTLAPIAIIWHYACHPVGHTPSQVTSADFPGFTRESLRHVYGKELPVLFIQGFCGDVRPNIEPRSDFSTLEKFVASARELISGTPSMQVTREAWHKWVRSLADGVVRIAASPPQLTDENMSFTSACADLPLRELFLGQLRVDTMLVRGLRIGRLLEIVALGAEPSAGWQQRLQQALSQPAGIRLFAAYCGDVFGYLPLPEQVREGGYEVVNFQPAFRMRGRFLEAKLLERVSAAVRTASAGLQAESVS
jgi:hypothetical protein